MKFEYDEAKDKLLREGRGIFKKYLRGTSHE
jgi:hypothetical protein